MSKFTKEYFINKFEAIPEEKWTTGNYLRPGGFCCALGHCGMRLGNYITGTPESSELKKLLPLIIDINDGDVDKYQQPNPKLRVLAALKDLK